MNAPIQNIPSASQVTLPAGSGDTITKGSNSEETFAALLMALFIPLQNTQIPQEGALSGDLAALQENPILSADTKSFLVPGKNASDIQTMLSDIKELVPAIQAMPDTPEKNQLLSWLNDIFSAQTGDSAALQGTITHANLGSVQGEEGMSEVYATFLKSVELHQASGEEGALGEDSLSLQAALQTEEAEQGNNSAQEARMLNAGIASDLHGELKLSSRMNQGSVYENSTEFVLSPLMRRESLSVDAKATASSLLPPVLQREENKEESLGEMIEVGDPTQDTSTSSQYVSREENHDNLLSFQTFSGGSRVAKTPFNVFTSQPEVAYETHPAHQLVQSLSQQGITAGRRYDIALTPAELGHVHVGVEFFENGQVAVYVNADKNSTLSLLQQDASTLHQVLADIGVNVSAQDLHFGLQNGGSEQEFGSSPRSFIAAPKEEDQLPSLMNVPNEIEVGDNTVRIRA